jgi:hypothetical protein
MAAGAKGQRAVDAAGIRFKNTTSTCSQKLHVGNCLQNKPPIHPTASFSVLLSCSGVFLGMTGMGSPKPKNAIKKL